MPKTMDRMAKSIRSVLVKDNSCPFSDFERPPIRAKSMGIKGGDRFDPAKANRENQFPAHPYAI
jgi:hypothetical protein